VTESILAIDPGPEQSAYVVYRGGHVVEFAKIDNAEMLYRCGLTWDGSMVLVIEQVAAMGMAVGAEVFETVFVSGRFVQAWHGHWYRVKRHEVKMFWCGSTRAKDANIRQSIIDRYGGKEKAIGRKRTPGPLYGIHKDTWQALALAICWHDTNVLKCRDAEVSPSASLNLPKLKGA
jgi:hypothetical protein